MKKNVTKLGLFLILMGIFCSSCIRISSSNRAVARTGNKNLIGIEKIMENPADYIDEKVVFRGFISQYTPPTAKTTGNYLVKGKYGNIIKVNTTINKQPKIQREYKIKGIVKVDLITNQPYIVELQKIPIIPVWLLIIAGAIVVLIVILSIVLATGGLSAGSVSAPSGAASKKEPAYDSDFKTVQIVTEKDKKTLVLIPGKLVFRSGEDKGKEIVLAGYPGADATIVTLGSREETGEKKIAHIRLIEPTVSRKQAEILHLNRKGIVAIKNLSKTNYTQVNGEEILPDAVKELKSGDTIKTGAIEFEYVV